MSDANRRLLRHKDQITLRASAQQAWDAIKNFDDIHTWHPAAVSTELLVGRNGERLQCANSSERVDDGSGDGPDETMPLALFLFPTTSHRLQDANVLPMPGMVDLTLDG